MATRVRDRGLCMMEWVDQLTRVRNAPPLVPVPHMHAAIKHDRAAAHGDHHAAAAYVLPGAQRQDLNVGLAGHRLPRRLR